MNNIADVCIRRWGISAFARYCRNIGIDFDGAYYMVFKQYPTR